MSKKIKTTFGNPMPEKLCFEEQHDISADDGDGNGYKWAICALTKSQREKSVPGKDYVQNPAYANSQENAAEIVRRWNCHAELLAHMELAIKPSSFENYGPEDWEAWNTKAKAIIAKAKGGAS